MEKRWLLLLWWLVVTEIIIVGFWAIYSIFGDVPNVTNIKMAENWTIPLPFAISRLWDIYLGPICSIFLFLVILLISRAWKKNDYPRKDISFLLGFGLVLGLIDGLVIELGFGLVVGPIIVLITGLGTGLVIGPVIMLGTGPGIGPGFELVDWLVIGPGFGLGFGLVVGLVFGLVVGLGFWLIFGLGFWLVAIIIKIATNSGSMARPGNAGNG